MQDLPAIFDDHVRAYAQAVGNDLEPHVLQAMYTLYQHGIALPLGIAPPSRRGDGYGREGVRVWRGQLVLGK